MKSLYSNNKDRWRYAYYRLSEFHKQEQRFIANVLELMNGTMGQAKNLILYMLSLFCICCEEGNDICVGNVDKVIQSQRDYVVTEMGTGIFAYDSRHLISSYTWNDANHESTISISSVLFKKFDEKGMKYGRFNEDGELEQLKIQSTRNTDVYHEYVSSLFVFYYDLEKQWSGCTCHEKKTWSQLASDSWSGCSESSVKIKCEWSSNNLYRIVIVAHCSDDDEGEWDETKTIELTYSSQCNPKRLWPYSLLKKIDMEYPALGYMGDGPQLLPSSYIVTETDTTKGECTYYHQERIKLDYVMQNGFISREIIDKDTIPYRYELIKSQKRN